MAVSSCVPGVWLEIEFFGVDVCTLSAGITRRIRARSHKARRSRGVYFALCNIWYQLGQLSWQPADRCGPFGPGQGPDIAEAEMLALQRHQSRRIDKVIFFSRRHHYDHATQAVGHSGRLDQGSRRSKTRARGQKCLQSSRVSRGECAERPRDHHLVTGFTPHGPAARLAAVDLRDQYADLAVVTRRISY